MYGKAYIIFQLNIYMYTVYSYKVFFISCYLAYFVPVNVLVIKIKSVFMIKKNGFTGSLCFFLNHINYW